MAGSSLEDVAIAVSDAGRGLDHAVYGVVHAADGVVVALLDVVLGVPLADSCDERRITRLFSHLLLVSM